MSNKCMDLISQIKSDYYAMVGVMGKANISMPHIKNVTAQKIKYFPAVGCCKKERMFL